MQKVINRKPNMEKSMTRLLMIFLYVSCIFSPTYQSYLVMQYWKSRYVLKIISIHRNSEHIFLFYFQTKAFLKTIIQMFEILFIKHQCQIVTFLYQPGAPFFHFFFKLYTGGQVSSYRQFSEKTFWSATLKPNKIWK